MSILTAKSRHARNAKISPQLARHRREYEGTQNSTNEGRGLLLYA